jgi:hypothetical protein
MVWDAISAISQLGISNAAVMLSEAKRLICFRKSNSENDPKFFTSLRMTV